MTTIRRLGILSLPNLGEGRDVRDFLAPETTPEQEIPLILPMPRLCLALGPVRPFRDTALRASMGV
jgi:hypothetical protein